MVKLVISSEHVALLSLFRFEVFDMLGADSLVGMLPIFLEGPDPLPELTGSIGGGNTSAGAAGCEFGAEQAVLVRDEATKQMLLETYGDKMIVLTVHECKGLEFQVREGEPRQRPCERVFSEGTGASARITQPSPRAP